MKGCRCCGDERRPRTVLQMYESGLRGSRDSQKDFQRCSCNLSKRRWIFFCVLRAILRSQTAFVRLYLLSARRRSAVSLSSSTSNWERFAFNVRRHEASLIASEMVSSRLWPKSSLHAFSICSLNLVQSIRCTAFDEEELFSPLIFK